MRVQPARFALIFLVLLAVSGCLIRAFITGPNQRFPGEPVVEESWAEKVGAVLYLPALLAIAAILSRGGHGPRTPGAPRGR